MEVLRRNCKHDPNTGDVPDINKRVAIRLREKGLLSSSSTELHDALVLQFPLLAYADGYECDSDDESPTGYTAEYLKNVVGGAKLYIQPLQKNITGDMDLPENLVSGTNQVTVLTLTYSSHLKIPVLDVVMCLLYAFFCRTNVHSPSTSLLLLLLLLLLLRAISSACGCWRL